MPNPTDKPKKPAKKIPQLALRLPDGGPEVLQDVTRAAVLGIAKPLDGSRGWIMTHLATGRVVLRTDTKKDGVDVRKRLEALDWSDLENVRAAVDAEVRTLLAR